MPWNLRCHRQNTASTGEKFSIPFTRTLTHVEYNANDIVRAGGRSIIVLQYHPRNGHNGFDECLMAGNHKICLIKFLTGSLRLKGLRCFRQRFYQLRQHRLVLICSSPFLPRYIYLYRPALRSRSLK